MNDRDYRLQRYRERYLDIVLKLAQQAILLKDHLKDAIKKVDNLKEDLENIDGVRRDVCEKMGVTIQESGEHYNVHKLEELIQTHREAFTEALTCLGDLGYKE